MTFCARLPTSSGMPLRTRLASACSASFSVSAAKPTHQGPSCSLATSARMSGLFELHLRAPPPSLVFLSFCALTFFTRQSATAATAMKMSASMALAMTASCICRAVVTDSEVTPRGTAARWRP